MHHIKGLQIPGNHTAIGRPEIDRDAQAHDSLSAFQANSGLNPNSEFWELFLVVVLVLGALAFCAGKDPHLSCNYFVEATTGAAEKQRSKCHD